MFKALCCSNNFIVLTSAYLCEWLMLFVIQILMSKCYCVWIPWFQCGLHTSERRSSTFYLSTGIKGSLFEMYLEHKLSHGGKLDMWGFLELDTLRVELVAEDVSAHCEAQICRTVWRTLSRKLEDGGGSASVKVPGPRATCLARRSAISFPWWPRCPAIQKSWSCQGIVAECEHHEMGWWRARRTGTRLVQLGNRKQKLF